MKTRNVTLALPEDLLSRVKVMAAKQETPLSGMLTEALRRIAGQEED